MKWCSCHLSCMCRSPTTALKCLSDTNSHGPLSALSRRNLRTARLKLRIVSSLGTSWPAVNIFKNISDCGKSYRKKRAAGSWYLQYQKTPISESCCGWLPAGCSSVWCRSDQWSYQAPAVLSLNCLVAPNDQRHPSVAADWSKPKRAHTGF